MTKIRHSFDGCGDLGGVSSDGKMMATNGLILGADGASQSTLTQADLETLLAGGSGTGDVTGPAASVDSEIALFSGTDGKTLKRASLTGLVKATSGVASAATAGTDYYAPGGTDVAVADGGTGLSSGTSGGVLAFTASGTLASSAALTSNAIVLGGGAGAAPKVAAGLSTDGTSKLQLGVAGTSVGSIEFRNATSGTLTVSPPTGALGTLTLTLPNASSTLPIFGQQVTFTGPTAARSYALPDSSDTLATIAATQTLTNKRVTKRIQTAADATSITPTGDSADQVIQANTQGAGTLTINAPTGTPTDGQAIVLRIKSTNAQTFSWNAIYRGGTSALPTAHGGSSKTEYHGFLYNSADSKWDYVAGVLGI